jgi:hypothetical protein
MSRVAATSTEANSFRFGLADKKDSVRSEAWKIASGGFATLERPDARGRPALEVTGS